ncbi:uncharacterized protein LOC122922748 [Bufo gargarizans]|uniref:uncharacterized protein LOC122922748 n=1 Tax=Bufo gargarizans TaxID=30331 RepID=UPI001CF36B20|nr:uncharacterized protein LOC122922748 [Bufo gargarizans]
MWSPGPSSFLLLLILELSPRPGDFQGASQFKVCPECKKLLREKDVKPAFYKTLVRIAIYTDCPNNIIRFQLPKGGIFCGEKTESWVNNVTKCIKQDRDSCLQQSESQKEFSKGSNEKPPITMLETTTSTARSTQTWKGGTSKPSEEIYTTQKILETTIGLSITTLESEQKNNLLQGNEPSTDQPNEKSKMKQMTIAIVSLLLIVLVMTSVGVYVWCRKVRFSECRRSCQERTVMYQPAPLEDKI